MKKMKTILCAVLIAALTLCLCACGVGGTRLLPRSMSLEEKLIRAAAQMKELKSMHMEMDMDMAMSLTIAGKSENAVLDTHYDMDLQTDPVKLYLEMKLAVQDGGGTILNYAEQDGDKVTVYTSLDEGATWTRETVPSLTDLVPQDPAQQAALILACAGSFDETGTETINGSPATVYSGLISGQYVEEAIKTSGALDGVAEALGGEVTEEMFKDLGDIPAAIAIDDDSCMPVRYTLEMSGVMQTLMDRLMKSVLAQYGLEEMEFEIKLEKMEIVMTLSRFNSVDEIVIPEAAKAA